jgi:CheY-like chemotaxis protein
MRRRQILVVEDNYLLLEMLTALCQRTGIAVVSVSSGEAAVAAIRQASAADDRAGGAFRLLLTDINLPGLIDGWSVAQAFRTLNPDGAVIYSSTGGCDDRRAVPDSVFLAKPFRLRDVVDLASSMLRESAAGSKSLILPAMG